MKTRNPNPKIKKGLCAVVLASALSATAPQMAYAPHNYLQEATQASAQAQQSLKDRAVLYLIPVNGKNHLIRHKDIYEITLNRGDSFYKYWENEKQENEPDPVSVETFVKSLEYINKKPFDPLNLIAEKKMRVWDLDSDGFVMSRNMNQYGRRLTEAEMDETISHNLDYDATVKK
jgi:hypothetical protein